MRPFRFNVGTMEDSIAEFLQPSEGGIFDDRFGDTGAHGLVSRRETAPPMWYTCCMAEKPLIETNPYLKNPKQREQLLLINVGSSTAIEIGRFPASIARKLKTLHSRGVKPKLPSFFEEPR